jgi:PHYB activation tagged suppressor 1
MFSILLFNSSEKYWHEPNTFDPSRFDGRNTNLLLAFSAGPRSCIGQNFAMLEAKVMLALIIKRFHFELISGQKHVFDNAVTIRSVISH